MKTEAYLVLKFEKQTRYPYRVAPKIDRVLQKKPTSGMFVKVELEFPDKDWFPTIQLTIDPLEVKGSVDREEMRDRAARFAEAFLEADK